MFITTVVSNEQNQDSISEASSDHHSHSHSHSNHGDHHNHGYKARILIKKIHVPVAIEKTVPYPVEKCIPTPMKVLVPFPYPVHKLVADPYKVLIKVPTPVYQRFPVEKIVPIPVKVPYDQPFPIRVLVPYPIAVEKNVPTIFRSINFNQFPQQIPTTNSLPLENPVAIKLLQPIPTPGLSQFVTKPEETYDQNKNDFPTQENNLEKANQLGPENDAYSQVGKNNFQHTAYIQHGDTVNCTFGDL